MNLFVDLSRQTMLVLFPLIAFIVHASIFCPAQKNYNRMFYYQIEKHNHAKIQALLKGTPEKAIYL